ncbi:hypothetical protein BG005_003229 [Podila minutissima]|nr:hypothetical protein BG005_003229 [Podila minutissima]
MFSSFKEKLNTSLTSIQEKAAAAAAAGAITNHGDEDHQDQGSSSPSPSSSPSIASRISGGGSTSLFRRSLQTNRQSADLISFTTSPPRAASQLAANKKLAQLVKQLTLDPSEEKPDPAQLEQVKNAEPAGVELSDSVIERLERLQRYEARFPDLATAFKRLVREKVAIEAVLKASTPLEDMSDVEALEAHLRNMAYKSDVSMQEIKRLSDELREASKMKEVHALESASQSDMIENLQDQLASKTEEIERLKTGDTESKDEAELPEIKETPAIAAAKQQEKIDELQSKIKSLEEKLASGKTGSDSLSDPLSASLSAPGTSGTSTASGSGANSPIAKEKKLAATAIKDQKKKDQALRDLMSRLDTVLKEKKQAQQEQEQAEIKLLQLQLDLDKEIKVKKEMVDKLDQLQKRMGEIEEKAHQDTVKKKQPTNVTDSLLDLDSPIPDSISKPAAIISVVTPSSKEVDEKEAKRKEQEQQWAKEKKEQQDLLHKAKADLESATQREQEAVAAKEVALQKESETLKSKIAAEKSLSDAQDAQKSLKDSTAQAERELKIAKVQIKELQKLDGVIDATKKELGQAQRDLLSAQDAKDKIQKEMETLAAKLTKEQQELRKRLEQETAQKLDQLKLESQNSLKAQETELKTLKETKQDLEKKMEQHTKDSIKADKETQNQLAKLQKSLVASEQTVAELAKERQDLETKLKETPDHSAELVSLSAKVSDKEKEVSENKRQIEALTKERTDLQKRLSQKSNLSKELESATAKVSAKEKEVEESKKQIQLLVTEKETLVGSIKKNQETIEALQDENTKILAEWKGKVDIMEKLVATKAAEVEEQHQEVNALTTEKDEILAKLAVVQELEQSKTDKINTLEAELSTAKQQYQDEIAKATAADIEAPSTETKDGSSNIEEELRAKVIQLEAEIQLLNQNPSKNAQKKLRQDLNHTKQAKQEAEALIATLKAELENAQNGPGSSSTPTANTVNKDKAPVKEDSKDKASDKTLKELKVQITVLEKSIKDKDNTLVEQQKQLDSELKRQETLQSRVKELEKAVATVKALEQEKENLTKAYHQLETKMEANSEEHHTTTTSLQKTLKELEIKEHQLSKDLEATKKQEKDLVKQLEEAKNQATTLASGNQEHVKVLEQLAALKSEREDLSKKLSDLEKSHESSITASDEKIKSHEKETTALRQKISGLETAVEKMTKEQERLSLEVAKAAKDLEASQKDEQVATAKIAELLKERDGVAEKTAALEKRLEKTQESKKEQETILQKQVSDLTQVKAALTKDLEAAQTKLQEAVQSSEDSRKEQEALVASLDSERDEALAKLTATQSELKTIQESVSKIGENQEKVVELTKELGAIKAELAKAEGQLSELQTSTSTEVSGLQEKILTLEAEKESIDKQKSELETQVKNIMAQADESAKLMKVLEEDNQQMSTAKTEAQEKVNELQSKVNTLTMKDRDTKEALALAKSTIHQRDEDLEATRKEKAEEEDKLQKSMTLLKTTRKQILRLEKEKQEVVEELEGFKLNMSRVQQEAKTAATKTAAAHATIASDLSRLQAVHAKMVQDKEKIIQEKDTLFDQLQMKHAEFESSQTSLENCEHEMREYRHQLEEARDRVTMLEEETSIAKRLADSKVAEFETLRRKAVELEQKLEQTQATLKTRADTHKTVLENLQQEVEETKETLGHEIKSLTELVTSKDEEIDQLKVQGVKSQELVQSLTSGQRAQGDQLDALQQEVADLKERKRNVELELQHFKDLECILAQEKSSHEKFVEDSKMREGHLRTVNKTLKEEVRKLQKQVPGSPSASTPGPYTSGVIPQTPGSNSHYANTPSATQNGRAMSPQSTPPSTPNFGRILQQQQQQHQDEDVNVEYLKNVLLSFMEHKERRQQLVPVVAQVLKLTPDETKRLSRGA